MQGRRVLYEAIRRMLSAQVYDAIAATRAALERTRPADADGLMGVSRAGWVQVEPPWRRPESRRLQSPSPLAGEDG